jgi:hypothetical protein
MCDPSAMYKNLVPTNARAYVRALAGARTPVDETFFQPEELAVIRDRVRSELEPETTQTPLYNSETGAENGLEVRYRPGAPAGGVNYRSPPSMGGAPADDVTTMMHSPDEIVNTTLGMFDYATQPNGDVIATDHYDFNTSRKLTLSEIAKSALSTRSLAGAYLPLRQLGGLMVPDDGNHGYPVRINLGNPSTWDK